MVGNAYRYRLRQMIETDSERKRADSQSTSEASPEVSGLGGSLRTK